MESDVCDLLMRFWFSPLTVSSNGYGTLEFEATQPSSAGTRYISGRQAMRGNSSGMFAEHAASFAADLEGVKRIGVAAATLSDGFELVVIAKLIFQLPNDCLVASAPNSSAAVMYVLAFFTALIIRLFIVCGLRAQEMFVLRAEDIDTGTLRVDEALKESEKGAARIGETKNTTSNAYVAISPELEKELRTWLQIRRMADPYHKTAEPSPNDLLFPSEMGTPYRIGNYLKRVLKPIAVKAGIPDLTDQALRRTFATHFQRYGSPKDTQAQLRHSKLEMTGWYMKQIPETVRAAVEKTDADLCAPKSLEQQGNKSPVQ